MGRLGGRGCESSTVCVGGVSKWVGVAGCATLACI